MNPQRDDLHSKRPTSPGQTPRPGDPLTNKDIARLNNRREELNLILQQWHRCSRMQADRAISAWVYNHSGAPRRPVKNTPLV